RRYVLYYVLPYFLNEIISCDLISGFLTLSMLGKVMAINTSNISVDDRNAVFLLLSENNENMSWNRNDAILMTFHDVSGGYFHR
ncbi:MAG: hypothetical protein ABW168_10520, partial [Sedimenticola sp.]